jgi:hypothetical protein
MSYEVTFMWRAIEISAQAVETQGPSVVRHGRWTPGNGHQAAMGRLLWAMSSSCRSART